MILAMYCSERQFTQGTANRLPEHAADADDARKSNALFRIAAA